MNNKPSLNKTLLSAAIFAFLHSGATHAAVQYSVTDLGTLGGTYSLGAGINELDEVTGLSYPLDNTANEAFLHDAAGISQSLGLLLGGTYSQGFDVNNVHQITGSATVPGNLAYHAFIWQLAQVQDLGTLDLLTKTGNSQGNSINDAGQVVGYSSVKGGANQHAVVWTKNATNWTINDLGTLDRALGTGNSEARGLNELGQVTGISSVPGAINQHAVVWTKNLTNWTVTDMGTLGGSYSKGMAINRAGDVTGVSSTALDSAQHAFIANSTLIPPVITDLNTLGGTFSEGYDINLAGDVVGYSTTAGDIKQAAFIWKSGLGMQDLNTLIDPLGGWSLLEAHAISDKGNITGIALKNGEKHAVLLTNMIIDTTPPKVNFLITPALPGLSGWYTTTPGVVWTVTDPESAISAKVGCADVAAVANTAGTSFNCTATSTGGTTGPVATSLIKVDTSAPTLAGVPVAFIQAATSLSGAVVNYTKPTATDALSGVTVAGVSCLPASGATFALGATTVNCSVTDVAGNSASSSFVVTVTDQTPPTFTGVPASFSQTTTSATGAVVTYTPPTANDAISGVRPVSCSPISGSTFGVGATTVNCSASDAAGNTATSSFVVTVNPIATDITPPVLSLPANIVIPATSAAGATVSYTATATDAVSGVRPVSCLPISGSTFSVGATTVSCSASDLAGNTANGSFLVTVNAPVITETITLKTAQCKVITATTGEWLIQGTTTIATNDSIQLYSTATVPADLTSNKLGAAVPVVKGAWQFQAKPGLACITPISLRSSAGKVLGNIAVAVQ